MENNRLEVLLYNAIVYLESDFQVSYEEILEELGMTEEEYDEIIRDDLNKVNKDGS